VIAAREERLSEAEGLAAKHQDREAAVAAAEAQLQAQQQQVDAAQAAANQRQQQLDELCERVKADSAQLRDQAQGFEQRRIEVITDLQVREAALQSREAEVTALHERLQEDRSRAAAEAARLDERARDSLRVVREAEEDYLAGRDRLEAMEREVRDVEGYWN